MNTRDFLVELGTEELPPKTLKRLMNAFRDGVTERLVEHDLSFADAHGFATPRRLAVLVKDLATRQNDRAVERRGPPVKIAFADDGKPTKAAEKFAESCGISVGEIATTKTDKGEWLFYRGVEAGRDSTALLPAIAAEALAALPIARRMRWGERSEEFVRPVHWAVMLFGDQIVPGELIGVVAGRETRGHRFHAAAPISLECAADYARALLDKGKVIADFAERRARIAERVTEAAAAHGGRPAVDDALLDEVTALVEWPVPVAGQFEPRFLELPKEVLISTLKDHQRFFPVLDADGQLLPWFITVSNIESHEPAAVKEGNERVVRPRLADAEFFYSVDRKTPLSERCAALADVVFQKQLGSLKDKADRLRPLAMSVIEQLGGDKELAAAAAAISKCDLLTDMVGEFPELQGVMGRYYASHDGQPEEVAEAMEEQYLPRFAGDALPVTKTGIALAIADKVDTLTGIFAIGKKPSGSSDPFGLRRAALGVLRILIEGKRDVDLRDLVSAAAAALMHVVAAQKKPSYADRDALAAAVFGYLLERLRSYFLDEPEQRIDSGMFEAVLATRPAKPLDFAARLYAVRDFMALEASDSLSAANKRIANILKGADHDIPAAVSADLLEEDSEKSLARELSGLGARVSPMFDARRYGDALSELANLKEPVDLFFDNVLVMADDPAVRGNRLALLAELRRLFLQTADFSKIQ